MMIDEIGKIAQNRENWSKVLKELLSHATASPKQ